MDKLKNP